MDDNDLEVLLFNDLVVIYPDSGDHQEIGEGQTWIHLKDPTLKIMRVGATGIALVNSQHKLIGLAFLREIERDQWYKSAIASFRALVNQQEIDQNGSEKKGVLSLNPQKKKTEIESVCAESEAAV